MTSRQCTAVLTCAIVMVALFLCASPGPLRAADGDEGNFLERYAETYRFRLGKPSAIRVTPDGRSVLFLRSGPRSFVRDLYELDVATGKERVLLTADSILRGAAEELSVEEKARRERMRLAARGIASYRISRDGTLLLVPLSGRLFIVERKTAQVRELHSEAGAPVDPQLSPDGKRVACVRDGELYVIDIASGRERKLTEGAGGAVTHGLAEFVAQEEMSRYHGFWWSPDSKRIAYQRTDTTGLEIMNIMDATRPERAPDTWPYPRPGKRNASVRLGIVSASGGPTTWVDWNHETHEYLAIVDWDENAPLTLMVQDRRQRESRLLAVNTANGSTTTLLVERDDAWVEIDERMPVWLPDGSAFLWTTERRGSWQLELRNRDGSLRHEVTPPGWGLRRFLHYFHERRRLVVSASSEPTETHLFEIPLGASSPGTERFAPLSRLPGTHSAVFHESTEVWVHVMITLEGKESWRIMRGARATEVTIASVAESPGFVPRIELTTVGDDPEFHAVIVRPRDFDPARKYPVIDHVYGGPTSVMVQANPGRYILDQWMADQGYIVVSIDGRGTPNRGRDWHRAVRHDLITVPLEDQARALRMLGEKYSELDLSRVGIYGWSFGGYFSAMAVMRQADLFRAGVAGAPVVDWQDYDTHYTERYMNLPQDNPAGYAAANVLTYADKLDRPLLIIHGTADDNVYFMHSLKLADALFRSGKSYDFLPLAGFTHMVPDPLVSRRLYTRIMRFLDDHVKQASTAPARP